MAARRKQDNIAVTAPKDSTSKKNTNNKKKGNNNNINNKTNDKDVETAPVVDEKKLNEVKAAHLPPIALVLTILVCSGILWIVCFRDLMSTGKPILGDMDEAMLHFTKSTKWFDDSKGWKSKQGGLSAIQSVTTDDNDMGGLFIRKLCGAAGLVVQSQKMIPFLFHPLGARWTRGHFNPLLTIAILGNVATAVFYYAYMEDLEAAGAGSMATVMIALLTFEANVMFVYLLKALLASRREKGPFMALPEGKTPSSITNRIVMRTVGIVSTLMAIIAGRDLFFPGVIIPRIPRDDIYLEWTGAFLHSPMVNSSEYPDQILEAPFYAGDKFVSQLMALYILIGCVYKFATAFVIRLGQNKSGEIKCKIIWKVQSVGDGLILFVFRLFALASKSASLDLRWHLMCIGYEAFILGLYAFM